MHNRPIPASEWQRLLALSELDLDLTALETSLQGLTSLAAHIADTPVSLVNLIDEHMQWSVARHGIDIRQLPREDSVCQYTILEDHPFEVPDLGTDARFSELAYVTGGPLLQYYYGIPLTSKSGERIGALCVLDTRPANMDDSKKAMLQLIAKEIVEKINLQKELATYATNISVLTSVKSKLAHDIRGPIGGIVGIARLFKNMPPPTTTPAKITEVFGMIENSGLSLIELADEILCSADPVSPSTPATQENAKLLDLKVGLEKLYRPMAEFKNIELVVEASSQDATIDRFKHNLMQICGNLISNAIKFTPTKGKVAVRLEQRFTASRESMLYMKVSDTGIGMKEEDMQLLMLGIKPTTEGTNGEAGFGLGLALVKYMVTKMNGTLEVHTTLNKGTTMEITIPQSQMRQAQARTSMIPAGVN